MVKSRTIFSPELKLEAAQLEAVQGNRFAPEELTGVPKQHGGKISMDSKGRWGENVFVERLWRSSNMKGATPRIVRACETPETH